MAARVGPEPSVVLTNRLATTSHCVKLTARGQAQSVERLTAEREFLGNCPPSPSLNQHFARSEK